MPGLITRTMSKLSVIVALSFCFWTPAAIGQELDRKPETIATTSALVTAELRNDKVSTKLQGRASFTLTEANSDDTMSGTLKYIITEESRRNIAEFISKPVADVPSMITVENVVAGFFEKRPSCPDLKMEIYSTSAPSADAKIHFDKFELVFQESSQELSKLLCLWAKRISIGRHGAPIRAINRLLKGEKIK